MMRLIELIFCFLVILLLSPLLILIAILIKCETKGPIIFLTERVGFNNIVFKMPKFRSMLIGTPAVATQA